MGTRKKKWTLFHPILCVKTHEALQLTLLLFFKSTQAKRLLCSSNKCMTIDLCNSYLLHVLLHTKTEKYFPKKGLALANNIVKC